MKTITLTNSEQVAIVDDLFFDDLMALGPWRLSKGYAEMAVSKTKGQCTYTMHKIVMQLAGHDLSGVTVDHRDRNRLDNRLANLRPATSRQQCLNQGRQRDNTSGFIGVVWHKQARKWQAQNTVNGKQKHLGLFTDKIEAARAYIVETKRGYHSLIDGRNFLQTKLANKEVCRLQAESHVRTLLQQQVGGIRPLAERRNLYQAMVTP